MHSIKPTRWMLLYLERDESITFSSPPTGIAFVRSEVPCFPTSPKGLSVGGDCRRNVILAAYFCTPKI